MVPNVYSQIFLHIVFSPKRRAPLLKKEFRERVFSHISGIITHKGHKSIHVNGVDDHVHIFIGYKPVETPIPVLVADIKRSSAMFINREKFTKVHFEWQRGYGVFSYGYSQVGRVYKYIDRQEEHHRHKSFREEYVSILDHYGVAWEEQFLFRPAE
jgi:putative transposase